MGHQSHNAALKGAQTKLEMEGCAYSMGQRSDDAARKDAQSLLRVELECAFRMGLRSNENDAAQKDAQTELSMEECASRMGQRSSYAAVKDVKIKLV